MQVPLGRHRHLGSSASRGVRPCAPYFARQTPPFASLSPLKNTNQNNTHTHATSKMSRSVASSPLNCSSASQRNNVAWLARYQKAHKNWSRRMEEVLASQPSGQGTCSSSSPKIRARGKLRRAAQQAHGKVKYKSHATPRHPTPKENETKRKSHHTKIQPQNRTILGFLDPEVLSVFVGLAKRRKHCKQFLPFHLRWLAELLATMSNKCLHETDELRWYICASVCSC